MYCTPPTSDAKARTSTTFLDRRATASLTTHSAHKRTPGPKPPPARYCIPQQLCSCRVLLTTHPACQSHGNYVNYFLRLNDTIRRVRLTKRNANRSEINSPQRSTARYITHNVFVYGPSFRQNGCTTRTTTATTRHTASARVKHITVAWYAVTAGTLHPQAAAPPRNSGHIAGVRHARTYRSRTR